MIEKIQNWFKGDIVYSASVIILSILAGMLFSFILIFLLNKWQKGKNFSKYKINSEYIRVPLFFLCPSLVMVLFFPLLRFPERTNGVLSHIILISLISSTGWFLTGLINAARETFLSHYDTGVKDNLNARRIYTQTRVVENVVDVIIFFITAALVLMTFDKVRQLGASLLASAGVIGIVIGFAAQKTLGNFIAGLQIAFTQPIRLDDVVIVENEWGWIEEITLTYVVVRIWDLRRLVLPISYFIEKPFQNWTRTSADILGSVYLYADYTVPVKELRSELTRILNESSHWDKKVNVLQVTGAKEQTIEIRALMSAENSPTAWTLRCEVREKLLEFLQERFPGSLPRTRIELKQDVK